MNEILWWSLYTLFAVWIQSLVSGADCFGPALVLCVQARRHGCLACLAPIWILFQEGAGSLPFGSVLLYYMGLIYFVFLVRAYISITSPMYILLLSLFAGLWHTAAIHVVVSLQNVQLAWNQILVQSACTAAVFPVLWALASVIYHFRVASRHARI